jgi:tRNA-dihydrouridine synthase
MNQKPMNLATMRQFDFNNVMKFELFVAVGVAAITVHGRYYWQKGEKRGVNDWEAIKFVPVKMNVPACFLDKLKNRYSICQ